jgi:TonB family protein
MPEALLDPAPSRAEDEAHSPTSAPSLLVELPSRRRVFEENLRDLFFPQPAPALNLRSAPAPFWTDVFVERNLPWIAFLKSCFGHLIAFSIVLAAAHYVASHAPVPISAFNQAQVIHYDPPAYLPPLDTRRRKAPHPAKGDPELARQPIISVPREADNHFQTIVTPPNIRLKSNVALPNMVKWSDNLAKPKLAVPDAPLTLAADLTRIAPKLNTSVVTPPPDAAHLSNRREAPSLQSSVVAPPPTVNDTSSRPLGDLNIARASVIAPAPQLSVSEQRSAPQGVSRGAAAPSAQVVPPPPSVSAAGSSSDSMGARGRAVALNLHPSVAAPPDLPSGNRRGAFAATPEGHPGALGSPGSPSATSSKPEPEAGTKRTGNLPSGLYVGSAAAAPKPATSAEATNATGHSAHLAQPSSANLSPAEREVFGGRKFYSLTLNMPNLNSAGGSWVIRFAPLKPDGGSTSDISEPAATRKVDPAYPAQLMAENVGGTVILYAVIHADGTVGNVRVLRGVDDRLDHYASQAVTQWKFQPATKNGTPFDVEATFQIPFHPQRSKSAF